MNNYANQCNYRQKNPTPFLGEKRKPPGFWGRLRSAYSGGLFFSWEGSGRLNNSCARGQTGINHLFRGLVRKSKRETLLCFLIGIISAFSLLFFLFLPEMCWVFSFTSKINQKYKHSREKTWKS